MSASSATLDSISRSLSAISDAADESPWGPARWFAGQSRRLQAVVGHVARSDIPSAPSVHTALRGISGELEAAAEVAATYRARSPIYVLIHCKTLCAALRDRTAAIGAWLALLDDALAALPDLCKKAADLAREMQQADLRVTENEERVHCTLQKEADVHQSSKAVQSAIIMDLARALGADPSDHSKLAEQIKLLKADLAISSSASERRILMFLERIFNSWSTSPSIAGDHCTDSDFEDGAHIPPFKNFLCPLTKEVMKDPVVLESSQTYERTAIQYWFDRCLEDGRDPTCPVTGRVLALLEMRPNIGLAGAIEEWVNRNIEVQVKCAVNYLGDGSYSSEHVECALDNVYTISEEYPSSRYRVRNAGIVGHVVRMLKDQSKKMGSRMRSKALMVMHSMAKDEESKVIMIEQGMSRLAIRSLTVSSEKEREYALRLLLEFSCDVGYCTKIALEKGALVLLSSMTGNVEHPTLSNLAEEILRNMERVEENIQHLALAGRFQPLLSRLCEGTEDVRLKIAILVGNMSLTNNGKDYIARKGGKVLVGMLSSKNLSERVASLQALHNLSTLNDNATILVDLSVFPPLTTILFATPHDASSDLKDLAAKTIANIVSNSGHWELSIADKDGHSMQSEFMIHRLLELLSHSSSSCQAAVLRILYGIASSPQASELAATHIRSGNGIVSITRCLEHQGTDHRIYALKLTTLLSERLGEVLADELRASNSILLLKARLLDAQCSLQEKSEITCILANLLVSDHEVTTILGPDLLKWTVSKLKEHRSGKNSRDAKKMVEGLIGLLLHYAKSPDPAVVSLVEENQFMAIFREQLVAVSHHRVKQRAVLGLKYLSESSRASRDSEHIPHGFCAPFVLICGRARANSVLCPLHSFACDDYSSFCLLKGEAIRPLIECMSDESTSVQIAAVEALSTIVSDGQSLKNAAEELEQLGLFDAAVSLLKEVRPGELQDRVMLMVDRFLRLERLVQNYATDQDLVRALVEALKHGSGSTKRNAQDALTNLRELSGVGGKNTNQIHGRRTGR